MINEPTQDELLALPRLGNGDPTPLEHKLLHLHFSAGSQHWFAAEYCPYDEQLFGYTTDGSNHLKDGWDYFTLRNLRDHRYEGAEAKRDKNWQPQSLADLRHAAEERLAELPSAGEPDSNVPSVARYGAKLK